MPIDYSKWDKIELSDDSDIEVHPNVDKTSFIKWKQRDIHEKRQQRNIEIKSILVQLTMYAKLNTRVDYILEDLSDEELLNNEKILSAINSKFDPKEKFNYEKLKQEKGDELRKGLKDLQFDPEEIENTPCYNEMIEDLFIQIKEDHEDASKDGHALKGYILEHRKKIDDVLSKSAIKLDDLLNQKANLISSDDIHTGFDVSFMNKDTQQEEEQRPTTTKEVTTTTEVINKPASSSTSKSSQPTDAEILNDLEIHPQTKLFAQIPPTNIQQSAEFLMKNTKICTEQQKDALLMSAFDLQLAGNVAATKQIIHQSLLLQYIAQLAGPNPSSDQTIKAIKLFCSKVSENSPAKQGFMQDVENTFNHIKTRCEIISAEHAKENEGEEEALIQLKALDDDTELSVNIPEPDTKEYEIFTTQIPVEMQKAVQTGSLDEVNKVFAELKIEEAENILQLFDECGVIGINAYLEDENDFKQLQDQYNENMAINDEKEKKHTQEIDTVDIVD
ncbi:hsp90 co-chaperone Cdc37 [[Candida] anglica]|uniref:Hsp90 chaperone protein kinase-targeting subunit n=1 Tax=[Candida] anglica TaxID=148631 RepID=A0ABP0EDP8_9ASCO